MRIKPTGTLMAGMVLMTVLGCGGGNTGANTPPPAPSSPKPEAAPPPAPVEKVEVVEEKEEEKESDYRYQQAERRDPFLSILVTTEGGSSIENLPPLQRTEIEDLRVIGIVWGEYGLSAMIQTPDGKGYTIQKGTLVGPNRGRVKSISKRFVSIEEKYTDIFGERKTRVVKLDLHPQKEGTE